MSLYVNPQSARGLLPYLAEPSSYHAMKGFDNFHAERGKLVASDGYILAACDAVGSGSGWVAREVVEGLDPAQAFAELMPFSGIPFADWIGVFDNDMPNRIHVARETILQAVETFEGADELPEPGDVPMDELPPAPGVLFEYRDGALSLACRDDRMEVPAIVEGRGLWVGALFNLDRDYLKRIAADCGASMCIEFRGPLIPVKIATIFGHVVLAPRRLP